MSEPHAAPAPSIAMPMMAGIGNSVMTIPLVRALASHLGARITILARTQAIGDVFRNLPGVQSIEVLGGHDLHAWRRHRRVVRALRPDVYLVPYPSNRWQYSLLAVGSSAGRVIMNSYPTGRLRALRFIPQVLKKTTFIPAIRGIHDAVQNVCLLSAFDRSSLAPASSAPRLRASSSPGSASSSRGLAPEQSSSAPRREPTARGSEPQPTTPISGWLTADLCVEPPLMHLTDADRASALGQLQRAGIKTPFIAIQPGCGDTLIGAAKRWPAQNFANLADTLADRGHNLLVIEGPDERGVGRNVSELSRSRPPVIELNGPLGHAAALLEAATLYVGNDSGLAHVAAAVGTPPVTLFAAADPVRVAPFGFDHLVVTPPPVNGRAWEPRLLYPIDYPKPRLTHAGGIDWAAHIRLEDVLAAIELALSQPQYRLTRTSSLAPAFTK